MAGLTPVFLLLTVAATATPAADPACAALHEIVGAVEPAGPAVAGAVIRSGEVVCEEVAGRSSLAPGGRAAARRAPFYLASLAKPMTAAAIAHLAANGSLSLDDPVRSHLPALPEVYATVTLRHLMRHEAGVADHFDHLPAEAIRGLTNEEVLQFLRGRTALDFEPGERWAYSNSGYVLLAEIVERVTGKEFGEWVEETFFDPFGMTGASVGAPPAAEAVSYERTAEGAWTATPVEPRTLGPGGVWASLADLEAWFLALRRGEVFSPEFLVQALAPTKTPTGKLTPFTIGFQVEDLERGLYYAGAFGKLGGQRNVFMWLPDRDAAFILLSARPDVVPEPLVRALRSGDRSRPDNTSMD